MVFPFPYAAMRVKLDCANTVAGLVRYGQLVGQDLPMMRLLEPVRALRCSTFLAGDQDDAQVQGAD